MPMSDALLPEFDVEMATTRRLLERVPGDRATWKPHPKSFSIAHLAQLVAAMPGWITMAITRTSLDLSSGPGYSNQPTEALVAMFDKNVQEAREAIAAASDADLGVAWSLTMGDKVLMTMPRGAVLRQNINHLIHHRGQLSVYLRLLEVPVPSIYGPTADEPWGSPAS